MIHKLNLEAVRPFPSPPKDVYFAILNQEHIANDPNVAGATLAVTTVCGTAGKTGYKVAMRLNWGAADLEIIETTLAATPDKSLRVSQRPDCFVTFNSNERRLPATVCMMDDLEGGFQRAFGAPPPVTDVQFDLYPTERGTDLNLTVDLRAAKKPNWFVRRRWNKMTSREVEQIFARIERALP